MEMTHGTPSVGCAETSRREDLPVACGVSNNVHFDRQHGGDYTMTRSTDPKTGLTWPKINGR